MCRRAVETYIVGQRAEQELTSLPTSTWVEVISCRNRRKALASQRTGQQVSKMLRTSLRVGISAGQKEARRKEEGVSRGPHRCGRPPGLLAGSRPLPRGAGRPLPRRHSVRTSVHPTPPSAERRIRGVFLHQHNVASNLAEDSAPRCDSNHISYRIIHICIRRKLRGTAIVQNHAYFSWQVTRSPHRHGFVDWQKLLHYTRAYHIF